MEAYKAWVRRNHQWLGSFESIANTMTWLLPERLASSELAPEAVSTMVGLVTLMNQRIVDTTPTSTPPWIQTTNAPPTKDNLPWNVLVSVVKELEVLVEMAAEQYRGKDGKWTIIGCVEMIKALLRLRILYASGYKMLLNGGETENTDELSQPSHCDPAAGRRAREGKAMQALLQFGHSVPSKPSWTRRTSEGATQTYRGNAQKQPARIHHSPSATRLLVLAEVIFILRPLMYVTLIRRHGLKSWKPWLTSLAVDITGLSLLYFVRDFLLKKKQATTTSTPAESHEFKRRQLLLALYLLRTPFFDNYTKNQLGRVERLVRPLPLFGTLTGKAMDLLAGVQSIYSYTSGS